jgi:hypothetical protein
MKIRYNQLLFICCLSFLFSCTKTDTAGDNSTINDLPKSFFSQGYIYKLFYNEKNQLSKMVKEPHLLTYNILDVDSVFFYYNTDKTLARMVNKTEFSGSYVRNGSRRTAYFFEYSGNNLAKIYSKSPLETEPVEIYDPAYELQIGPLDYTTKVNSQLSLVYDAKNRLSEIYSWRVQANYPGIVLNPSASHYTRFSYSTTNDSLVNKIEVNASATALPSNPAYNYIALIAYDPIAKNPFYKLTALPGFPLLLINMLPYDSGNIPNPGILNYYVCLSPYLLKNFTALNYYFNSPSHHYYTVINSFHPDGKVFSSTSAVGGSPGVFGGGFSFKY